MTVSAGEKSADTAKPGRQIRFSFDSSKARIGSGLVLFIYVVTHFITHAFGLISLEVLQAVGDWTKAFWRFLPINLLLYAALLVHLTSAIWKIFTRRTLRMPLRDWAQLILGLSIPFLLIAHVVGTRYAASAYGVNDTYAYVLLSTFVLTPISGVLNSLGLLAAWIHGCIGLNNWLTLKKFYTQQWRNIAFLLAIVIPLAALAGFLSSAREVAILSTDGDWLGKYFANLSVNDDNVWIWINEDTRTANLSALLLLVLLIGGRFLRNYLAHRSGSVVIEYHDGPKVRQPVGATLLEISRSAGVGHANVCGGRGRCSTCRVRILESQDDISTPSDLERRVLTRVGAGNDVRLACQLIPQCNLKVLRLLPSETTSVLSAEQWSSGEERVIAVLFADLRDFTRTSENRLPFDVVYLINQFSRAMGQSVESNSGRIDKFLGDGMMALFGIETSPQAAAQNALKAALEMHSRLVELNQRLASDLDSPLRMGIGIHVGPVVLGSMGYGASRSLTAIGDTVNTASRLESETKNHDCTLCISSETAHYAGFEPPENLSRNISVRGKRELFSIFTLDEDSLGNLLNDPRFTQSRDVRDPVTSQRI